MANERAAHLAHVARSVTARFNNLTENEEALGLAVFAMDRIQERTQEAMAEMEKNALPPNAEFPETRNQTKEQALKDHAATEDQHRQFKQKLEAASTEANNSPGRRHVCREFVRADDAKAHVIDIH